MRACSVLYRGESCSVVPSLLVCCILRVAISGSSALLVLRLQRVRVLLGSHAERGPLAGGGAEDAKKPHKTMKYGAVGTQHGALRSHDYLINKPVLPFLPRVGYADCCPTAQWLTLNCIDGFIPDTVEVDAKVSVEMKGV